ncbi:MAG: peptidylprolyl isomerase [Acidobacteria bacterium]|nr:MAG: peptidylprolyl isomerase [Acidobacteriota bacterium]
MSDGIGQSYWPGAQGPPPEGKPAKGNRKVIIVALVVAALIVVGMGAAVLATRERLEPAPKGTAVSSKPSPKREARPVSPVNCPAPAKPNYQQYSTQFPMRIDPRNFSYEARVATNFGEFTIELFATDTPVTVNNFASLACAGFYNGTLFHRITTSPSLSVIQGGDATTSDGTGGPGYQFSDELSRAKEGGYPRGVVAMANAGPDTNGSQFFIVVHDAELPPHYTVFGEVSSGMSVVDSMYKVGPRGSRDSRVDGRPRLPIEIESISIVEKAR